MDHIIDYLEKFKEGKVFKSIEFGVSKNQLYEIIIGDYPYSYSFKKTDQRDQIPSMVYFSLHILLKNNKITNEQINNAIKQVPINNKYVCLLLEYYYYYIIYLKKMDNLIKIDFTYIIDEIKNNINKYENEYCVSYLIGQINQEIKGEKFS